MTKLLALPVLAVMISGCSLVTLDLTPRIRPLQEQTVEGSGRAKILLLDVSGFLSEVGASPGLVVGTAPPRVPLLVRLREELKKAAEDPDIIHQEIDGWKRETGRPVVAVMLDVAASGGYYVALAADTIVAHPTSVTGSIGVIMFSLNAEGLMQKVGLSAGAIKSGERKDMGSPFRTLTDEERKIFQGVIDNLYAQFVAKLVAGRRLPPETARSVADGRIYSAQQALALKLVDRVGYMPDAIDAARRAAGVDEARVVVYHRPRDYRATYYASAQAAAPGADVPLLELATLLGAGPRFLYLWWP